MKNQANPLYSEGTMSSASLDCFAAGDLDQRHVVWSWLRSAFEFDSESEAHRNAGLKGA